VIDPYSGDILGIAGAIGKKSGNRLQNFATTTKRPSGSAIKPLSVYAPAIEKGLIQWSTVIVDSPITNSNGDRPWPMNASRTFEGNVDIKYAVENSLNTVPVKILKQLGNSYSFDFITEKLRIKSLNKDADIGDASLALGQHSVGISLLELSAAYSVFEDGIMCKPRSYYKVTDFNGRIILDNVSEQEAVISKETAAIMTKLLEGVVENGTAKGMISLDENISVAGKTGTTQNNCDRYFIGYTPELLAGVWFGYEYPKDLSDFGGNISAYIWNDVMTEIYQNTLYGNTQKFKVPETVKKLNYLADFGTIDGDDSFEIKEGWFDIRS
jgi:penicillin-binding protein 1A